MPLHILATQYLAAWLVLCVASSASTLVASSPAEEALLHDIANAGQEREYDAVGGDMTAGAQERAHMMKVSSGGIRDYTAPVDDSERVLSSRAAAGTALYRRSLLSASPVENQQQAAHHIIATASGASLSTHGTTKNAVEDSQIKLAAEGRDEGIPRAENLQHAYAGHALYRDGDDDQSRLNEDHVIAAGLTRPAAEGRGMLIEDHPAYQACKATVNDANGDYSEYMRQLGPPLSVGATGDPPPLSRGCTSLFLNSISLSGTIPVEIGTLITTLTTLSMYHNSLSGTLPTALGLLTALVRLSLAQNSLSGSLPTELGRLTSLLWLDLGMNSLTGSIPTELGALTMLTGLRLDHNALHGTVPVQLRTSPALISKHFEFQGNELIIDNMGVVESEDDYELQFPFSPTAFMQHQTTLTTKHGELPLVNSEHHHSKHGAVPTPPSTEDLLAAVIQKRQELSNATAHERAAGKCASIYDMISLAAPAQFSYLLVAIDSAEEYVRNRLRDPMTSVTMFAPSDGAFDVFWEQIMMENRTFMKDTILVTKTLLHHMSPLPKYTESIINGLSSANGAFIQTVLGPVKTLLKRPFKANRYVVGKYLKVAHDDVTDELRINDALVVSRDIPTCKSVIHVVDGVLFPDLWMINAPAINR